MKSLFSGYYLLSDSELTDLWKNGTFIFDTNVLLSLYRYPKATSDELIKILNSASVRPAWLEDLKTKHAQLPLAFRVKDDVSSSHMGFCARAQAIQHLKS